MKRCLCKKEISEWLFNFSEDEDRFEKNNILGEKLKLMLLAISKGKSQVNSLLLKIENNAELRKWFLKEIKKLTHKNCYGWQCKFKIFKINKKCSIHKRR